MLQFGYYRYHQSLVREKIEDEEESRSGEQL
jgi:hypothetical protein